MRRLLEGGGLEAKREALQSRFESTTSIERRKPLGQFATPFELAVKIVKFASHWVNTSREIRFLEPALGTGVFYSAILQVFARNEIVNSIGIEIDPRLARASRRLWKPTGLRVLQGDFTKLKAPTNNSPNLIVTNPPYVRHHDLTSEDKNRLNEMAKSIGFEVSGYAGLDLYFLLFSHAWLSDDGIGAWLVSTQLLDSGYGRVAREYLTERVSLLHIHRFDPTEIQFKDATVSSALVIYQNKGPTGGESVGMSSGELPQRRASIQTVPLERFRIANKWSFFSLRGLRSSRENPTLGSLFHIMRGVATGSNRFFILQTLAAKSLRLPKRFLRPILPNPSRLIEPVIESESDGTPALPEKLVLVDCNLPEKEVSTKYPRLWRYLSEGKEKVASTYLASKRDPWYRQEHREPPPFLMGYISRERFDKTTFRFFWNKSNATASNSYLLLYPKADFKSFLEKVPSGYGSLFSSLLRIEKLALIGGGRVYGGGLLKLEPRELGRVRVPLPSPLRRDLAQGIPA